MTWRNDASGFVCKPTEVKVYHRGGHTWAMKLSQLKTQTGTVRIITYSLPDVNYVVNLLGKRPHNIFILCHAKFLERAREIKRALPGVRVAVIEKLHAKMLLIEPSTVYIGSANFGHSGWIESEVGIRDKNIQAKCVESFEDLWQKAQEIN